MPGETISCHAKFLPKFSVMILQPSWIHIGLTLSSLLNSKPLHQARWESDLHLLRFSLCHNIAPQFLSVKADGQQTWVRQKEFVHVLHLTELSSSSLLNHIASPGYLPCGFCETSPVRHFDQQRLWWSYNDSTTLTYLVFH